MSIFFINLCHKETTLQYRGNHSFKYQHIISGYKRLRKIQNQSENCVWVQNLEKQLPCDKPSGKFKLFCTWLMDFFAWSKRCTLYYVLWLYIFSSVAHETSRRSSFKFCMKIYPVFSSVNVVLDSSCLPDEHTKISFMHTLNFSEVDFKANWAFLVNLYTKLTSKFLMSWCKIALILHLQPKHIHDTSFQKLDLLILSPIQSTHCTHL